MHNATQERFPNWCKSNQLVESHQLANDLNRRECYGTCLQIISQFLVVVVLKKGGNATFVSCKSFSLFHIFISWILKSSRVQLRSFLFQSVIFLIQIFEVATTPVAELCIENQLFFCHFIVMEQHKQIDAFQLKIRKLVFHISYSRSLWLLLLPPSMYGMLLIVSSFSMNNF